MSTLTELKEALEHPACTVWLRSAGTALRYYNINRETFRAHVNDNIAKVKYSCTITTNPLDGKPSEIWIESIDHSKK